MSSAADREGVPRNAPKATAQAADFALQAIAAQDTAQPSAPKDSQGKVFAPPLQQPPALYDMRYLPPTTPASALVWLWLANALGPASAQAAQVLEQYPNPADLLHDRFALDLSGLLTPTQLIALREKEPEDFTGRLQECERLGVHIVAYDSESYPVLLRHIDTPPPVLFYRGDLSLLGRSLTFAIVGTRRPSAYGVEATRDIAQALAKAGVVLVSGLAAGLDSETHKAAVQNGVPTVACIAFGHDLCYPAQNKQLKGIIEQQGLVVGEYPPGTVQQKPFFLQRNRLIAGLSYGLCVAEARRLSGTMNTVEAALRYGRDVFSVPGSIFSPLCEGTNALLKEGAMPATSAADVLAWYHRDAGEDAQEQFEQPDLDLSPEAGAVMAALSCRPQPLDALCASTKLPLPRVMAALTELELAGISSQQAGRQFVLNH